MAKREIHYQDVNWGNMMPPYMPSYRTNLESMIQSESEAMPSWEKEFCLEAKQDTKNDNKVLHWNDSAAEEALHAAKYTRINGALPYADIGPLILDLDTFIDELIEWLDDGDDLYAKLLREKLMAKLDRDDEEEDYRYYSQLIEQTRLDGQGSEV